MLSFRLLHLSAPSCCPHGRLRSGYCWRSDVKVAFSLVSAQTDALSHLLCYLPAGRDEHVCHSPYPLRVLPARPTSRHCQVAGPGRSTAVSGAAAHFVIDALDEFGNRCVGAQ